MGAVTGLEINGRVAAPDDPDWDEARRAWNLAVDQQPVAVTFVESAEDLAAVVRFADRQNLKVLSQATGHGAAPFGPLDQTIIIKTERMRGVEVDAARLTARVEAGVLTHELGAAAQAKGLCSLPGSSPDTGVVGYTLGGGLSWLGRAHGFACNRVRAIELVTAEGEQRTVDADQDADLFWALRGGGGSFATVTALEIELLALAEVYAGTLILAAEVGSEAIRAYRDWAAGVPEEMTSIVRFLRPPPFPDVPEPIRGRPLLTIGVSFIGSRAEGESIVAPLRELGQPIMDTIGPTPVEQLCRIHMDPEHPVPGLGHHAVLSELPDEAIEAFVATAGPDSGSPLLLAELRQLGGALGRGADQHGALSKLDGAFAMFSVGTVVSPESGVAVAAGLDRLHAAMQPWAAERGYLNFADRPCGIEAIHAPDTCARLRQVKQQWDPSGLIRPSHAF